MFRTAHIQRDSTNNRQNRQRHRHHPNRSRENMEPCALSEMESVPTAPSSDDEAGLEIPKFAVGQKVYAPDRRGHVYLASILKISHKNALIDDQYVSSWQYYIHYVGWKSTHDDWISESCLHPDTEEIRIKAERDRESSIEQHKAAKRKRKEQTSEEKGEEEERNRQPKKRQKMKKTQDTPPTLILVQHRFQALVPPIYIGQRGRTRKQSTEMHPIHVVVTLHEEQSQSPTQQQDQPAVPNPYFCVRCTPIDYFQKSSHDCKIPNFVSQMARQDNSSVHIDKSRIPCKEDGESQSRNSRVRQREFIKKSSSSVVDDESPSPAEMEQDWVGCESNLRFDKSRVHGWGVYATELIKAGEFIVEYRGILIGNVVADVREKIYERAQIGSDYMFRLDAHTVVDATRKGNLARFINASCNPNCFTKIVTTSGIKRIGIYAKRDIQPGEELNYDYKFALEMDESKRIPCRCGSDDCRGFMNWDKRKPLVSADGTPSLEKVLYPNDPDLSCITDTII